MTQRIVTLWNDTKADIELPPYEVDGETVREVVKAGCGYDTTGEHYDDIKEWVRISALRVEVVEIEDDD